MATAGEIKNIQGITLGNGKSTKIDLSVIERAVLKNLSNNTLGIYATALVENPRQVKAGTVIYRLPELIKTKAYNPTDTTSETPQVATIAVNLDTYRAAKWELEDFDIAAIESGDEIASQIAQGLSLAMQAEFDYAFFKKLNTLAESNSPIEVVNPLSTTKDDIQELRLKIADTNTELSTIITKTMLGANEEDTLTITSPKLFTRLVESLATAGSDKGFDALQSGKIPTAKVAGYTVTKHFYLGQNVDASKFSDLSALDLSKVHAIILNRQAIAMPMDLITLKIATNPGNGNPIFIQKYRYGIEALRGELIKSIKQQG